MRRCRPGCQCCAAGQAESAGSAVAVSSAAMAPSRVRCGMHWMTAAGVVAFLASDDARWVTCRVIDATGGSGP